MRRLTKVNVTGRSIGYVEIMCCKFTLLALGAAMFWFAASGTPANAESKQTFDAVLAFTGTHPDTSLSCELQLHVSPVTGGAYGIHQALSSVTDCLSVPLLEARDLASGEPGFYLVGCKSYGRMATFLLKDGRVIWHDPTARTKGVAEDIINAVDGYPPGSASP